MTSTDKPPTAWLGYGHNPRTGEFTVRICRLCPDTQDAIKQAKPLNHQLTLCPQCFESMTAKEPTP